MKTVSFAGSAIGSHWYEVGHLLQRALKKQDIDLTLNSLTTDYRNVQSVGSGESDLGVAVPLFLDLAQRRESIFKGADFPELRVIAAVNSPLWVAAAIERSTGIETLAQIRERKHPWRIVIPPKDNLNGEYIDHLLAAHGFSREDIVAWGGSTTPPNDPNARAAAAAAGREYVMRPQTRELAKKGAIDGLFVYFGWTSAWTRDLTTLMDLRFLRYDPAALDAVLAKYGGQKLTLPNRIFPGVDEDITVPGWRYRLVYGTVDTPDDLVATVLSALEDEEILDNAHGFSYSAFEPPRLPASLQLHPVTQRYFDRVARLRASA